MRIGVEQAVIGAVACQPVGQVPLVGQRKAMCRHLADGVGHKQQVRGAGHPPRIVLILHGEEVVFGDGDGRATAVAVPVKRRLHPGHHRQPGRLRLGQGCLKTARRLKKSILVDDVKIQRLPRFFDHLVAPIAPIALHRHTHRAQLDGRIDGAHGLPKFQVARPAVCAAANAPHILTAVAGPHLFPAPRHAVRARLPAVHLVAKLPVRNAQRLWVAVVGAQLRPLAHRAPIAPARVRADNRRIVGRAIVKSHQRRRFLGRAVGINNVHRFRAGRFDEIQEVGGRQHAPIPGAHIVHLTGRPIVRIAPTAPRNAHQTDAGRHRAVDKGAVLAAPAAQPRRQIGPQQALVERLEVVWQVDGDTGGQGNGHGRCLSGRHGRLPAG